MPLLRNSTVGVFKTVACDKPHDCLGPDHGPVKVHGKTVCQGQDMNSLDVNAWA